MAPWLEFWLIVQANKIGDRIHCTASKVGETWLNCRQATNYYLTV